MPKTNKKTPRKRSPLMTAAKAVLLVMTAVWSLFMTSLAGAGLIHNRASYGAEIERTGVLFLVSAGLLTAGALLCLFRKTLPNVLSLTFSLIGLTLCMVMLYRIARHADLAGWSDKYTMEPISGMYKRRLLPVILPAGLTLVIAAVQIFSYEAAEERRERRRRREEKKNAPAPPIV